MHEYLFQMPYAGVPGEELQKVQVKIYEAFPPHHGWVAHIESTSPPYFKLNIGQNLFFTDEALLLNELVHYYGLVQE